MVGSLFDGRSGTLGDMVWSSLLTPFAARAAMVKSMVGEFHTVVQHGEIQPGTFHNMLRDLRIDRREF